MGNEAVQSQQPLLQSQQCSSPTCRSLKGGCIIGNNHSPTSICETSLFTDACLAIGDCDLDHTVISLAEVYNNISSTIDSDGSATSPSSSDDERTYPSDDERFDPIQMPIEEVEIEKLNDDFALESNSYLRVLFDEPMAHDQRFAPLW